MVTHGRGYSMLAKSGRTAIGCLLILLVVGAAAYAGISAGRIYFRYYAFEDAMRQSARFAESTTDSALQVRLANAADSLGLPYAAHRLRIQRVGRSISISGEYEEVLDLRVWKRVLRFRPNVQASY